MTGLFRTFLQAFVRPQPVSEEIRGDYPEMRQIAAQRSDFSELLGDQGLSAEIDKALREIFAARMAKRDRLRRQDKTVDGVRDDLGGAATGAQPQAEQRPKDLAAACYDGSRANESLATAVALGDALAQRMRRIDGRADDMGRTDELAAWEQWRAVVARDENSRVLSDAPQQEDR